MSLFSAIMKGVARYVNDSVANHNREKAKKIAFKNTGKKIQSAKKSGTFINGSQAYKKELRKQTNSVNRKHKIGENFINDL